MTDTDLQIQETLDYMFSPDDQALDDLVEQYQLQQQIRGE